MHAQVARQIAQVPPALGLHERGSQNPLARGGEQGIQGRGSAHFAAVLLQKAAKSTSVSERSEIAGAVHTRSTSTAIPCPPLTHSVAMP